jgi:hypothetical protein
LVTCFVAPSAAGAPTFMLTPVTVSFH